LADHSGHRCKSLINAKTFSGGAWIVTLRWIVNRAGFIADNTSRPTIMTRITIAAISRTLSMARYSKPAAQR
jgi:hypothetical protein